MTFDTDSEWPTGEVHGSRDYPGDLSVDVFQAATVARRLRATQLAMWPTDAADLEALLTPSTSLLYVSDTERELRAVVACDDCLVDFSLLTDWSGRRVSVRVSGISPASVRKRMDSLRATFPRAEEIVDDRLTVRFWAYEDGTGSITRRKLDVPTWAEVRDNYAKRTQGLLTPAMEDLDSVARAGRLMLWHGLPGTGKTHALRALGRSHAKGLKVDYITDPEMMFGASAKYMLSTILHGAGEEDGWRLLVLEDADELISADAKLRAGQGLARLLNLVDGFVGQGLHIMVLITTNEPVTAFHPAITRPGRCGSLVEFEPLTEKEAAQWLRAQGLSEHAAGPGPMTVADLFALKAGYQTQKPPKAVGFRRP